jgi:hypothetical protein
MRVGESVSSNQGGLLAPALRTLSGLDAIKLIPELLEALQFRVQYGHCTSRAYAVDTVIHDRVHPAIQ